VRDLTAYQRHYAALAFERTQAAYRRRKVLEVLGECRPRRVLEVGCGLEPLFLHYADFDAFTVVEPGDEFVRHARELAAGRAAVTIVTGTLEQSLERLAGERYDCIIMASLLHEVGDSLGLLRCAARLCHPDTLVHVNVPNAHSFHRLLALEMGIIDSLYERSGTQERMQQSHTFDLERLGKLAAEAGFSVVAGGSFFIKPFTHAQMAALQEAGLLTEAMLDGLYKLSHRFPQNGSEIFVNLKLRR
jgi:2-polyprenyl-3-methyl-5-hydroxy-6-metoxy-1,4-benzoquinol methylase